MVVQQNVDICIVWDSEWRDYIGIITIRDLLEILVFFCDSLKDAFTKLEDAEKMKEQDFIQLFFKKYVYTHNPLLNDHSNEKLKMAPVK